MGYFGEYLSEARFALGKMDLLGTLAEKSGVSRKFARVKRIYRKYMEEGLRVRRKRRKRLVRAHMAELVDRTKPAGADRLHCRWSCDGANDVYFERSRCLHARVPCARSRHQLELFSPALERLIDEHGWSEKVRTDSGPELISRRMTSWEEDFKVGWIDIELTCPPKTLPIESGVLS